MTYSPEFPSHCWILTILVPCVLCSFTSRPSHSPNLTFPPSHFLPFSCLNPFYTHCAFLSLREISCALPRHTLCPSKTLPCHLPTFSFPLAPLVLVPPVPLPRPLPPRISARPSPSRLYPLPLPSPSRRPRGPIPGAPKAPAHPPPSHSPSLAAAPPSPMVEMKVVLKASSEKRKRRQVLPTPESPISSSLNR